MAKTEETAAKQKARYRIRKLKNEYLDEVGQRGGNSKDFRQIVLGDLDENPAYYQVHIRELLLAITTAIWEDAYRPDKGDKQKCLPGLDHVFDLTVYDPEEVGSYLKVLVSHATLKQLRDDSTIKFAKIAEATRVASYELTLYWDLMKACGSKENTKVLDAWNMLKAKEEDEDDRPPPSPFPDPGPPEDDDED
jgi:hypothetical protein